MRSENVIHSNTAEVINNRVSNQKSYSKKDRAVLWVSIGAFVIILPLVVFAAALITFQVGQLNLPNIFIFDQQVGSISRDVTATLVDEVWNQDRQIRLIALDDMKVQYQLTPLELGLWVDPQATANAAYRVGRSVDPFRDLTSAIRGQSKIIMPVLFFDENHARKMLESIGDDLFIPPEDATLAIQDGAWIALPGREGRALDIEVTLNNIVENGLPILLAESAPLSFKVVSPDVADLSPLIDQIEALLEGEYQLSAYDPITDEHFTWSVPLEQKASWVKVSPEDHHLYLSINADDVAELLIDWEGDLGEGRSFDSSLDRSGLIDSWQNSKTPLVILNHDPFTYQVSRGESLWSISLKLGMPMWHILEANPELTVNNLTAGMNLTIPSKNILLPLPVVTNKRIVIDLSEQRMTVLENGHVRNTHIISTGVADSPTMAGIFQVQTHEINAYASNWDLYMPHFLGIYEAWPGFINGIHGLPLLSSGNRLWASNLGSPASYGCIILDLPAAEDLYYWAETGVVVEIRD
jgi:hypothetical protein